MIIFNQFSCLTIMGWCLWAVLSPYVQDGLIGKILYSLACISALALVCAPDETARPFAHGTAESALHFFLAMLMLREVIMQHVWFQYVIPFFDKHPRRRRDDLTIGH